MLPRLEIFAIIFFVMLAFKFHLSLQAPGMIFIRKHLVCSLRVSTVQSLN